MSGPARPGPTLRFLEAYVFTTYVRLTSGLLCWTSTSFLPNMCQIANLNIHRRVRGECGKRLIFPGCAPVRGSGAPAVPLMARPERHAVMGRGRGQRGGAIVTSCGGGARGPHNSVPRGRRVRTVEPLRECRLGRTSGERG